MQKKLILFDFDGVIVSTFDFCYQIHKNANPKLTKEEYALLFNDNIYRKVVGANHVPNFFDKYSPLLNEKGLVPGIKEVVEQLARKATLVIVTSTPSKLVGEFLDKHSIGENFSGILGLDVDSSKVIKIKLAMQEFEASSEETIMITDTAGDIYEARAVGVDSIAVDWGFQTHGMIEAANPLKIISRPQELLEML